MLANPHGGGFVGGAADIKLRGPFGSMLTQLSRRPGGVRLQQIEIGSGHQCYRHGHRKRGSQRRQSPAERQVDSADRREREDRWRQRRHQKMRVWPIRDRGHGQVGAGPQPEGPDHGRVPPGDYGAQQRQRRSENAQSEAEP